MSSKPKVGDYVLATRWSDGSPMDKFCIGFVSEIRNGRYIVGSKDVQADSYRRAEKITADEGRRLCWHSIEIENVPGRSLWEHLRILRNPVYILAENIRWAYQYVREGQIFNWRYISTREQVYGLRNIEIYGVAKYWKHKDYRKIVEYCDTHGIAIIDVSLSRSISRSPRPNEHSSD